MTTPRIHDTSRCAATRRALALVLVLLGPSLGCATDPVDLEPVADGNGPGPATAPPATAPEPRTAGPTERIAPPPVATGGDVLVRVGTDDIGARELADRFRERHREKFDNILKDLLVERVVRRENETHKIDVPAAILDAEVARDREIYEKEARLQYQMGLDELLKAQGRSSEDFTRLSREHALYVHTLRRLVRHAQLQRGAVKVRHIVVKTREEALGLHAKLVQGADFATLARQHSLCPSRRDGGNLAMVVPGVYAAAGHAEVEATLAVLDAGQLSSVVAAKTGFHVFEALYREPPHPAASYAELADRVASSLERFPVSDEEIDWWLEQIRPRYPLVQHF